MTKSFRDRVELDDGSLDLDLLAEAWWAGDLTHRDHLKVILEHVYYSHENPEYRRACAFISEAAAIMKKEETTDEHD